MNPKCPQCSLVNFSASSECGRCGSPLRAVNENVFETRPQRARDLARSEELDAEERPPRSLARRIGVGLLLACAVVFVWHLSLLHTSAPANLEERLTIERAIKIIESKGFRKDAFLLRRFASFRTTDNWWNRKVGHADAYAATNFPFEIVTLYPDFFNKSKDDTERAVILLHEARHLAGADEEEAFRSVWRDRVRLGYTNEEYSGTRVWLNIAELTFKYAPDLFPCGPTIRNDCSQADARTKP